jgi:chemotaxis signal transduction protein
MSTRGRAAEIVADLRREFDDAFARPPEGSAARTTDFLGVRAAGAPYAIALADVGAVQPCGVVAQVPSRVPGLAGLAGVQASLLAVFDILSLLGAGGAPVARRWLVVARCDRQVAIAVDAIDGFLQVEERSVLPLRTPGPSSFSREVLDDGSEMRPILDVEAAVDALREIIRDGGASG